MSVAVASMAAYCALPARVTRYGAAAALEGVPQRGERPGRRVSLPPFDRRALHATEHSGELVELRAIDDEDERRRPAAAAKQHRQHQVAVHVTGRIYLL